jgi:hypothetical protein
MRTSKTRAGSRDDGRALSATPDFRISDFAKDRIK